MIKSNVLKVSLMGLFLVSLFLGITSGVSIDLSAENGLLHRGVAQHKARVYSLYLGVGENVGIKTTEDNLIITNGIVVGDASSYSKSTGASIGGGVGNTIESNSQYAGIAGGGNNTIVDGENSIIGGGSNNSIDGKNAVVAGGQNNTSHSGGNVMGGVWNSASGNSVVLGGEGNMAEENSLALGKDSDAQYKSFAWNAIAEPNSARINASNGVLIGTTQPITGVNLVVNGAMKIGGTSSATGVAGEIRSVSGCFYAYDGVIWHIINRNSRGDCNTFTVSEVCKFGNIELQEGDVVIGYRAIISTGCDSSDNRREVRCTNGELLDSEGNTGFDSPYCYTGRGNLVSFTPPVTCPSIGSCRNIAAGGTCISYSVGSSSNCTGAKITSTCNDDGTWSVTPGAYGTCEPPVAKCAAIGACPETEVGGTCVSYSASGSTNCTGVKITSTCNTNGTWSATPGSYGSCTVKCAAVGACSETMPGGTCVSYSASGSTNCDGVKVTSTCNSNGTWNVTPGDYGSCTAQCQAGYYKDGNECVECPAGSYCPGGTEAISCPSRTYSTGGATSCTACGLDAVYVSRSSPTGTYYYAPGYIYTNNNPGTLYFYVKTPAGDDNWNISTVQIANNTNLSASIVTRSGKKAIQVSYTYASDWTSHSPGWVGYVNVYWEGEIADAYRASCGRVSPGTFAFYNSLSNCTTNSNQVCQSGEYSYCCVQ